MSRWALPARGALAQVMSPAHRVSRRIALFARSFVAAFALALSTLVGVAAAFLALLPPALSWGPEGRRVASIARSRPAPESEGSEPAEQALPR